MLGGGSLADAINNFETKFKDKSGLKWEDRGAMPKSGKCKRRYWLILSNILTVLRCICGEELQSRLRRREL